MKKDKSPKPRPSITVGKYIVVELENGNIWIQIGGGEGMETPKRKFEEMIDKFWRKEF